MKRSEREENGIIIHFVFYFILAIGLMIFVFVSIIPEVLKIENDKTLTKDTYKNIKRIETVGLNFNEFISLSNSEKTDKVILEILKNMDEEFYTENLVNNTDKPYKEFLNAIEEELNSPENKTIVDDQIKQISAILPSYSEPAIDLGGGALTDYKFVNYIETILETFGVSTNSSIGIGKIKLVEDYVGANETGGSLDSNIFYIPLNLVLKGQKSGIIDFLYFIENVGNIKLNDKKILLSENYTFLSRNGRKIVFEGEKYVPGYNILNHQIIDIEKISMENYIDSSYQNRERKDFKDFIVENQGNEEFEINVNLLFYIKGQPSYKTEEFIDSIFQKHTDTVGLVSEALKDMKLDDASRIKLIKQNTSLKQMNKEIMSIKKDLVNKDKLEELYKRVMELDVIIDPILKSFNK